MNKEEIQVGDLVRYWATSMGLRAGLVIDDHTPKGFALRYRVYWFNTGSILRHSRKSLIKLDIPNEPK